MHLGAQEERSGRPDPLDQGIPGPEARREPMIWERKQSTEIRDEAERDTWSLGDRNERIHLFRLM